MKDGQVLVVGGTAGAGSPSAEVYNPGTDTWASTASLVVGRANHVATILTDGRVLVAGGLRPDFEQEDSAEIYDPSTGAWNATASMSVGRAGATGTQLSDGRFLVAGGVSFVDSEFGNTYTTNSVQIFSLDGCGGGSGTSPSSGGRFSEDVGAALAGPLATRTTAHETLSRPVGWTATLPGRTPPLANEEHPGPMSSPAGARAIPATGAPTDALDVIFTARADGLPGRTLGDDLALALGG
jgi:hypothetical protein